MPLGPFTEFKILQLLSEAAIDARIRELDEEAMSIKRFAARRDANDASIAETATKLGWWLIPLDTPCDYLGWHPRFGWIPIEIKRPDGPRGGKSHNRLTKAQVQFHLEAQARTAAVLIWKNSDDVVSGTERFCATSGGTYRSRTEVVRSHASVDTLMGPQKSTNCLASLTAALHTTSGWAYSVQAAFVLERFATMRELLLNSDAATNSSYASNIRDAAKIAAEPIWQWSDPQAVSTASTDVKD